MSLIDRYFTALQHKKAISRRNDRLMENEIKLRKKKPNKTMNFLINRKFLKKKKKNKKKNKIKKVRSIIENCKLRYVKIKDAF